MKTNYNKYKLWCVNKHEWEKDEWHITPDGRVYNPRFHRFYRPDTHILIQNTGIPDMNKKEIYEGYTLAYKKQWKAVVKKHSYSGGWYLEDIETGKYITVLNKNIASILRIVDTNPEILLKTKETDNNEQKSKPTF